MPKQTFLSSLFGGLAQGANYAGQNLLPYKRQQQMDERYEQKRVDDLVQQGKENDMTLANYLLRQKQGERDQTAFDYTMGRLPIVDAQKDKSWEQNYDITGRQDVRAGEKHASDLYWKDVYGDMDVEQHDYKMNRQPILDSQQDYLYDYQIGRQPTLDDQHDELYKRQLSQADADVAKTQAETSARLKSGYGGGDTQRKKWQDELSAGQNRNPNMALSTLFSRDDEYAKALRNDISDQEGIYKMGATELANLLRSQPNWDAAQFPTVDSLLNEGMWYQNATPESVYQRSQMEQNPVYQQEVQRRNELINAIEQGRAGMSTPR